MVRKFRLVNEKGQEFSMMDIENYTLLTDPAGLGYAYVSEYQQIGNTFIESLRQMQQGQINGTCNFLYYDNYKLLVDFIESSESLKFGYKIPYKDGSSKEFFKNVNIQILEKAEKGRNGVLSSAIIFDCLTLWYEEKTTVYTIKPLENEIRWDYRWDSRFTDYDTRNLEYINTGHVEAPVYIEIDGQVVNPVIKLFVEGELYQTIEIKTTIEEYEKLLYDSREGSFSISKQNTDGTILDLFDLDYIDPQNDNVLRLPKNKNCKIVLTAENEVLNAKITVYSQYKAV